MLKRFSMLWMLIKGDARRLWYALGHPDSPGWLKAGTALVVLYLVSPIDLIPDVVPVFGFVDDMILVPAVIHWMLTHLPAHVRAHAERRAAGRFGGRPTIDEVG